MIVSGSASQSLSAALAAETGEALAPVSFERFPDGELLAAVDGAVEGRAVVVGSTVSSDAHLEVLQLQDAVREAGATEVVTVLPYMGYARQDQAFETGQPVSARAVARALSPGTDRVVTVNPHEASVCDFFDAETTAVDAAGRLAEPLPDDLTDPVFIAPDEGATDLVETIKNAYGRGETDYFEKTRHSGSDVEIQPHDAAIEGRDVVVVDDIIATGSTMSATVDALGEQGVARTFVTCVHPMLAANARSKLARAGVEAVYGTDTIERPESTVSVAPAIAAEL